MRFRDRDLDADEVESIFTGDAPASASAPIPSAPRPALANYLLRILQSRRINGSLDLDLPRKLVRQLEPYPDARDKALAWLRQHNPIDEDAAILRRIQREEAGYGHEEFINRAESLGLYKPQSGSYDAKLGDQGDIYGESILTKIRKKNEAKAEQEEKELDEYIQQKQKAIEEKYTEKSKALEATGKNALQGMWPPKRESFRSHTWAV